MMAVNQALGILQRNISRMVRNCQRPKLPFTCSTTSSSGEDFLGKLPIDCESVMPVLTDRSLHLAVRTRTEIANFSSIPWV